MNQEDYLRSVAATSVDAEFVRMQVEQAMETVRAEFTLLVQVVTALLLANVTVAGLALSTQSAGLLLLGFLFPTMILYTLYRIDRALLPVAYTAVNLEAKYGEKNTDWLVSTFIAMLSSAEAIGMLKEIGAEQDYTQRITRLRKARVPILATGRGIASIALAIVALAQLVAPFILVLAFQWTFF